jgi:hypothetical protein
MLKYYKLDGKNIVGCQDLKEWASWYEAACTTGNRHVALDMVWGMRVSTIFLGMDHSFFRNGPPILFETMVFVGRTGCSEGRRRYCTWDEAEAGHKEIIQDIKSHPWEQVVQPWARYLGSRLRNAIIELANKVLAWMWPAVIEIQSAIAKIKAKLK